MKTFEEFVLESVDTTGVSKQTLQMMAIAYEEAREAAYNEGHEDGYNTGKSRGYDDGYSDGREYWNSSGC